VSDAVAADGLSAVPAAVRWTASVLFVLAVPFFLILGNVLNVASDRDFYLSEFALYGVGQVTGLDNAQLAAVADAFIAYLRDPAARLDTVEVTLNGARRPLFNEKELRHMADVKVLFGLVERGRLVAGTILLVLPLLGLWAAGAAILPRVGMLLTAGGIVTVVVLALAGLLSLVDFSAAFITFHEMAFSNADWMLDPRTDYLIMLYPEGFWLDATLRIAMLSAIEAAIVGAVGLGIAYFGVRR
jgi:integral membrane protein (TIGR01906 family)